MKLPAWLRLRYPSWHVLFVCLSLFYTANFLPWDNDESSLYFQRTLGWPMAFQDKNALFIFPAFSLAFDLIVALIASFFMAGLVDWLARQKGDSAWLQRTVKRISLSRLVLLFLAISILVGVNVRSGGRFLGWPVVFFLTHHEGQFCPWALLADLGFAISILWAFLYIFQRLRPPPKTDKIQGS